MKDPGPPSDPGLFVMSNSEHVKILGQPVTFERTGSRLVNTMTLTAHDNVQLPGSHAQTVTDAKPVFVFVPSRNEVGNGVTGGDLLLVKLETHGDRRQIEIAAGGSWRASKGVSITHQLSAVRSEIATEVSGASSWRTSMVPFIGGILGASTNLLRTTLPSPPI